MTKKEIMEGIECESSKVIAGNTVAYFRKDATRVIRLHRTDILEFPKTGEVIFNSGGWKTVTTKERMNRFQDVATIVQDKGLWYVSLSNNTYQDKSDRIPYFDGMIIKDGKVLNPIDSPHDGDKILLKKIQKYCKELKGLAKLPIPNSGDCFMCQFGDENMGDDHLISHLNELYIHGSLIFRALKNAGYADPSVIFQMDIRDSIVRAVRKYFKSRLGLVQ
jgi:hypothetical protein